MAVPSTSLRTGSAEHSTAEGGEVRPKRPTRGKAKPGITGEGPGRREGLRAYKPSQQTVRHRRMGSPAIRPAGCSPDGYPTWSKELEPRNRVREFRTHGSVGGGR
jgi:hypothetical protein